MTFGRAIIEGIGLGIGATIVGAGTYLISSWLKPKISCPNCGAELPTEVACRQCGSRVAIQPIGTRKLGDVKTGARALGSAVLLQG